MKQFLLYCFLYTDPKILWVQQPHFFCPTRQAHSMILKQPFVFSELLMYFFLLNPCFYQHYTRVSTYTFVIFFSGGYQLQTYPVAGDNDLSLLQISTWRSLSPSIHTHVPYTVYAKDNTTTSIDLLGADLDLTGKESLNGRMRYVWEVC